MIDVYSLDAYSYDLPEARIAQSPAAPRDSSRLLAWSVGKDEIAHLLFRDIPDCLDRGDLLVLNDTRVLQTRLYGHKEESGGRAEILLLEPLDSDFRLWRALVRPGRRLPPGTEVRVGERTLTIEGREDDGVRVVRAGTGREDVLSFLDKEGRVPLPPYIKKADPLTARESYQTVFARRDGSAAAPTAGLHFTEELLKRIGDKEVETAWITLHVGLGTFRPVKAQDIREHRMHGEFCEIPEATEDAVRRCRARGGRVVAVGTTVARALESGVSGANTRLFIYPGFAYKVVDALITNFHLPGSSLLMLVAAFAQHLGGRAPNAEEGGRALEALKKVYSVAIAEEYRFFSFGDAMFLRR